MPSRLTSNYYFGFSFTIYWNFSRLERRFPRRHMSSWYASSQPCSSPCSFIPASKKEKKANKRIEWLNVHESDMNAVVQGDFVDRGYNSVETFTILMLLKARYVARNACFEKSCNPLWCCVCAFFMWISDGCCILKRNKVSWYCDAQLSSEHHIIESRCCVCVCVCVCRLKNAYTVWTLGFLVLWYADIQRTSHDWGLLFCVCVCVDWKIHTVFLMLHKSCVLFWNWTFGFWVLWCTDIQRTSHYWEGTTRADRSLRCVHRPIYIHMHTHMHTFHWCTSRHAYPILWRVPAQTYVHAYIHRFMDSTKSASANMEILTHGNTAL